MILFTTYLLNSLLFCPQEFMQVTGLKGIGKSTLFNLLFKFYESYEGDIYAPYLKLLKKGYDNLTYG